MRKPKEKNYVKSVVWWECIIMTLILISSMVAIFYMCWKAGKNPEAISVAIEGTLLSNGLAIVGMAISIWAGLSIIQVLEKDKLLELEREVQEYKRERHVLNKRNFLNNILEEKNELNLYIYKRLKKSGENEKEEISAEVYFELNQIEEIFREIYRKRAPIFRRDQNEYHDVVEKCQLLELKLIAELKKPDVYLEYIKIRILEFEFYRGYTQEAKEDGQVELCFNKVIDGFSEIFAALRNPEKLTKRRHYLDGDVSLTIYMLNTIGEAYSKIIESYGESCNVTDLMREQAKQAKKYYDTLLVLLGLDEIRENAELKRNIREIYYRNYGCLLERISRNIDKNVKETFVCDGEIHRTYQKAIDVMLSGYGGENKLQPFHTYLSFYEKVMKNFEIKKVLDHKGKGLCETQKRYKDYTYSALYYAQIAENNFPTMHQFVKFRALVERDLAIWAIKEKSYKQAKYHLCLMKTCVEHFAITVNIRNEFGEKQVVPEFLEKDLKWLERIIEHEQ